MKASRIDVLKNSWMHLEWWQLIFVKLISQITKKNREKRVRILDEEWDNIIILDACRFDFFKDVYSLKNLPGSLYLKKSLGTETTSFLRRNFGDIEDKLEDIVYITANPFVDRYLKDKFFKIIPIWKYGWDSTYNTVLPETMYFESIKALLKYPDKRFIIHFIQPHYPYIGSKGQRSSFVRLREEVIQGKNDIYIRDKFFDKPFVIYAMPVYATMERELQVAYYWNNLKRAVYYVSKLINILPGTTIVTADHGESLGEPFSRILPIRIFGHIPDLYIDVLEDVPWLVIPPQFKKLSKSEIKDIAQARKMLKLREIRQLKKTLQKLKTKV